MRGLALLLCCGFLTLDVPGAGRCQAGPTDSEPGAQQLVDRFNKLGTQPVLMSRYEATRRAADGSPLLAPRTILYAYSIESPRAATSVYVLAGLPELQGPILFMHEDSTRAQHEVMRLYTFGTMFLVERPDWWVAIPDVDFVFRSLARRLPLAEWSYELEAIEAAAGRSVARLAARSHLDPGIDPRGMGLVRYWIDQECRKIVRADYYDRGGHLRRHFEGEIALAADGSWCYTKLTMRDTSDGSVSILRLLDRTALRSFRPGIFMVDSLGAVPYPHETMGAEATMRLLRPSRPATR